MPLPTNPVWSGSMHAISSYCGNIPKLPIQTYTYTHTQTPTHPPTNRQDRLQYTATQLVCSVTIKQHSKPKKNHIEALFHVVFVEIISLTQIGLLRRVFLANHLASTETKQKQ